MKGKKARGRLRMMSLDRITKGGRLQQRKLNEDNVTNDDIRRRKAEKQMTKR